MDEFLTGRNDYRSVIARYLAYLSVLLEIVNNNHLTDLNDSLEQTFCTLLNKIFNWNLVNVNAERKNFPGIDLADDSRRISVQISSDATPGKVRETLCTFFDKELDYQYRELYIVFMKSYRSTVKSFYNELVRPYPFAADSHILDKDSLFARISSFGDVAKLKEIADFLREECGKFPHEHIPTRGSLETAGLCSEFYIEESRTEQIAKLAPLLQANEPLFIWGPGGIGKTQFAQKIAWKHKTGNGPYTIKYIPSPYENEDAMQATILNAPIDGKCFIGSDPGEREKVFSARLEYMSKNFTGAIVIVDDFYLPGRTLDQLKREVAFRALSGIGLHLIFTTRYFCTTRPDAYIAALTEGQLMNQIRAHCSDESLTDERLRPLLGLVGCNSMLAYLFAETMCKGGMEPEHLITALESGDYSSWNFPNISDDRTGLEAPFHEHMYNLYDISALDDQTQQILALLLLAPQGGIDMKVFRNALSDTQKVILLELIRSSWICQENGKLVIYPVAVLVCRNRLEPSFDILRQFLCKMKENCTRSPLQPDQFAQVVTYFDTASEYFGSDHELLSWHEELKNEHAEERR